MSVIFVVEEKSFSFTREQIAEVVYLKELVHFSGTAEPIVLSNVSLEDFSTLVDYLEEGKIPPLNRLEMFEFFKVKIYKNYELSCLLENDMRNNAYRTLEEKYFSPGYGLTFLDENLWNSLSCVKKDEMLFSSFSFTKASWERIEERLADLRKLLEMPGVFIAGGSIISILTDQEISDIDIFLCGLTEAEATETVCKFPRFLESLYGEGWNVLRTSNAVTFIGCEKEIQIITRLYKTESEVLHGFDVCSSCVGLTKQGIVATYRGLYALENARNTISFSRLSPSYEYRLAKYGTRGFGVYVPQIDFTKINKEKLLEDHVLHYPITSHKIQHSMRHLHSLNGLDLLLFLETRSSFIPTRAVSTVSELCSAHSDYSFESFKSSQWGLMGSDLHMIMDYLYESRKKYSEVSTKYADGLQNLDDLTGIFHPKKCISSEEQDCLSSEEQDCLSSEKEKINFEELSYVEKLKVFLNKVRLNSIPLAKRIQFMKANAALTAMIIDIPRVIYDILVAVRPCDFTSQLTWKAINPGEQMTNTFHQIVLEDNDHWYKGRYYGDSSCSKLQFITPDMFDCTQVISQEELFEISNNPDTNFSDVLDDLVEKMNSSLEHLRDGVWIVVNEKYRPYFCLQCKDGILEYVHIDLKSRSMYFPQFTLDLPNFFEGNWTAIFPPNKSIENFLQSIEIEKYISKGKHAVFYFRSGSHNFASYAYHVQKGLKEGESELELLQRELIGDIAFNHRIVLTISRDGKIGEKALVLLL